LSKPATSSLKTGAFPTTYEELQAIPVQQVGQLTFAGDDGMQAGQTYRALVWVAQSCDRSTRAEARQASLALRMRAPDPVGSWVWGAWSAEIPLPAAVLAYLEQGATPLAPTLREIVRPDGRRLAVLDLILDVPTRKVPPLAAERRVLGFDWGVRSLITASVVEKSPGKRYPQVSRPVFLDTGGAGGRQARLRREIDRLKACREHYAALYTKALKAHAEQQKPLPADLVRWQERVHAYEGRIGVCWQKYARRNRELAHLAANLLILLALLADCHLICGENLATLRTEGRGRGMRGRWRNWRNNTTVRGELWRVLSYKCLRLRIRARQVEPRGTTHPCPHCHQTARTFASPAPADRRKALEWGSWLCCENPECLWNGARDYAASLNIARLGLVLFLTARQRTPSQSNTLTSVKVKPVLYSRAGATLLLPSQGITPRPKEGKHVCSAGWSCSPLAPDVSTHGGRRGALDRAPAQTRPRAEGPANIAPCGCNGSRFCSLPVLTPARQRWMTKKTLLAAVASISGKTVRARAAFQQRKQPGDTRPNSWRRASFSAVPQTRG
jgi:transposase